MPSLPIFTGFDLKVPEFIETCGGFFQDVHAKPGQLFFTFHPGSELNCFNNSGLHRTGTSKTCLYRFAVITGTVVFKGYSKIIIQFLSLHLIGFQGSGCR